MATTTLNVVRTITMRAKTEGVDESTKSVDKLAASQDKLAASSKGLATVTDQSSRRQLSQAEAFRRFERSVDPAARASQKMAAEIKRLNDFQAAGEVGHKRAAELLSQIKDRYGQAGQAAGRFAQVSGEVGSSAAGMATSLGLAGRALVAIGPVGIAIGVALAAVTLGFGLAAAAALRFADDMGKLADTADTIGFTVEQLKALEVAAADVGISGEQLNTMMEKFTVTLGKVREGDEGAIKALERLETGLSDVVRSAGTAPEKFQAVIDALGKVDKATAAVSAREIFGKSGLAAIRLAGLSLDDLVNNMNAIDKAAIANAKSFDAIGDSINKNFKQAGTNVVSAFAGPVLEAIEPISKSILELSRTFVLLASGPIATLFEPIISGAKEVLVQLNVLNIEIANLGAGSAFQNLGERLFGHQVTTAISLVVTALKGLGEAILALISLFASLNRAAVAALTFNIVGNFQTELNNAAAAVQRMGAAYVTVGNAAAVAIPEIVASGNAAQQTGQSLAGTTESWVRYTTSQDDVVRSGEKWLDGQKKVAPALNASTSAVQKQGKELKETSKLMDELAQAAGQLGSALVGAFLKGESAGKALKTTLQSISSSATSSAITNLIKGDLPGAAISGGIALGSGILSFLFGDDEEDKRNQEELQRQQAESAALVKQVTEAWAALADELADFERQAAGMTSGTLRPAIDAWQEQEASLQAAASAAGDAAGSARVAAAGLLGLNRILTEFGKNIDVTIKEFGEEGTILSARAAVKSLMDEFDTLTQDIIVFGEKTGDSVSMMERLGALQREGIEGFLNLLDISEPLSDIQQQVVTLNAVADELRIALQELNITAEEAAFVVDTKLNAALSKLQADFLAPLIESINEFVGGGWINEAVALQQQVQQLRDDAIALGLATTLIDTFYVIEAQKIINSNELVGASFTALVNQLNLGEAGLHEFSAAIEDATDVIVRSAQEIANAIQANEDRLFLALHRSQSLADQLARFDLAAQREREEEIAAGGQALASLERALAQERANIINDFLDEQRRAAQEEADRAAQEAARIRQEQIDAARQAAEERKRILDEAKEFIEGQVRRIKEWIANFLAGPNSILPPSQQLATAQSHFASERALAASGNRDALSNITSAAQTLVDATRRYYGSSVAGQTIIQNLLAQLEGLPAQLSPEEFIVGELKPPITNIPPAIVPPITGVITDQTTVLQFLLNNLKTAVQTGDAQATAIALLPLFETLDTTMDKALSFDEFKAGLGTSFTTGTLRGIFNELDGNGNGFLEKAELIKVATQGTKGEVTETNTLLDVVTDLLGQIKTSLLLLKSIDLHVQWCDLLQHIHTNTQSMAQWAPGSSHELGGLLTGPRHSAGGIPIAPGHYAEGGEYIMSRRAVAAVGVGTLDAMNYGHAAANDNIFSAIRGLERSLLRGIKALMDTQLEAAGVMAAPLREANKLSKTRRGEKKTA